MHFRPWKRNEVPDPFQDLLRQQQEFRQTRKELVRQLYETIAELEGRPVRKLDIGFPLNLIVRFVSRLSVRSKRWHGGLCQQSSSSSESKQVPVGIFITGIWNI